MVDGSGTHETRTTTQVTRRDWPLTFCPAFPLPRGWPPPAIPHPQPEFRTRVQLLLFSHPRGKLPLANRALHHQLAPPSSARPASSLPPYQQERETSCKEVQVHRGETGRTRHNIRSETPREREGTFFPGPFFRSRFERGKETVALRVHHENGGRVIS